MLDFTQTVPTEEDRPTKVDSRKKAIRPSMASGAPKISPHSGNSKTSLSELELHGQTGCHAQRKVDTKQLAQNLVISL